MPPLQILTWNLGYAGLGREAEFLADGGSRLRVACPDHPRRWARGIADFIASRAEDVLLLQEAAKPSWINHGNDLLGALRRVPSGRTEVYAHEVRIPLPFGAGSETGCAIFCAPQLEPAQQVARLPGHGRNFFRQYPVLLLRFDSEGASFTIINAHLSAFDAGARLRSRQLRELLRIAGAEYATGRHVVIGADFNYELAPPPRPHTTDPKHMEWLHRFPPEALGAGWRIAVDTGVPTFRSADKPYVRGENYAGIIDGFIVSPNVHVLSVAAIDLGFACSDHNPVTLTVSASSGAPRAHGSGVGRPRPEDEP
jgi:endonuclease/exonuclease/phosphatase family metal-dependent hydrolase